MLNSTEQALIELDNKSKAKFVPEDYIFLGKNLMDINRQLDQNSSLKQGT